jgi:hypothetical protein
MRLPHNLPSPEEGAMSKTDDVKNAALPIEPGGPARARTISHLERILRTATAVGAGVALSYATKVEAQRPPQVCDPLPPPIGCCKDPAQFLLRGCLEHQTRWVKDDKAKPGRQWRLEVSLWVKTRSRGAMPPEVVTFASLTRQDIKATGASLRDMTLEPRRLALTLVPAKAGKQVDLELWVLCNDAKVPIRATLDISKPPEERQSVPIKIFD